MKNSIFAIILCCIFSVNANEIIPTSADIHPEIMKILRNYAPLQKGGYRFEKFSDEQYIVVGIGKASLQNGFAVALRTAELNAELQISKAINPTQITVEISKKQSSSYNSAGDVDSKTIRKKFVNMLVSSHTPFIYSCGVWKNEKYLYCAKAVFVGDFDHTNDKVTLKDKVKNVIFKDTAIEIINSLPYLSHGGTVLINACGKNNLLTVVSVKKNIPASRKLIFARNQAYKNLLGFISGEHLEQQLSVLSENLMINGQYQSQRKKIKELEATVKGTFQFIEPQARWQIDNIDADFFLYIMEIDNI